MRWAMVVLFGALCAGCVADASEPEPEHVQGAQQECIGVSPPPHGVVADPQGDDGAAIEEAVEATVARLAVEVAR